MCRHKRSLIVLLVQVTSVLACAGIIWFFSFQSAFSQTDVLQKDGSKALEIEANNLSKSSTEWQDQLNQYAENWIEEISQDKQFSDWKERKIKILPFAPGSKQWVVLLEPQTQQLQTGYLLIACTELSDCTLLEYGWLSEEKQEFFSGLDEPLHIVHYDLFWLQVDNHFNVGDFWSGALYDHVSTPIWKEVLSNISTDLEVASKPQALTAWQSMHQIIDPILFIPFSLEQQISLYHHDALAKAANNGAVFLTYHPPFEVNTYLSVVAIHSWEIKEKESPILYLGVVDVDGSVRYIQYKEDRYLLYQL